MILCLSGGLDSVIAYYYLNKPKTVFFDYGDYTKVEKERVLAIAPNTIIDTSLNLAGKAFGKTAYIPYRNLLFASLASRYSSIIAMAGVKDDVVPDKSPEAFSKMGEALTFMGDGTIIDVVSPFWDMTKADIVSWAIDNLSTDDLETVLVNSISCYHPTPEGNECKNCPSCFRKWNALDANGIRTQFNNLALMKEYLDRAKNGEYIPERNASIIKSVTGYMSKGKEHLSRTYCFDIDGVLTIETEGYGEELYRKRTPNVPMIEKIKKLHLFGNKIVLYTSRHKEDVYVTCEWLDSYGVPYESIQFEKPKADYYIDDKMLDMDKVVNNA